jgi:hypothetical protein
MLYVNYNNMQGYYEDLEVYINLHKITENNIGDLYLQWFDCTWFHATYLR